MSKKKMTYKRFLSELDKNYEEFRDMADKGGGIRHSALLARKKSIELRRLLKEFRLYSLENDKKISKIMKEAKKKIDEL